MKHKDFKSSLEFLLDYGFEYTYDSETGKRQCYKNRFGEIVLDYKRVDPNYWIPQICSEINYYKQIIDVEKKYSVLKEKRSALYNFIHRVTIFDKLYEIAKNEVNTGKIFDILIEPKYIS